MKKLQYVFSTLLISLFFISSIYAEDTVSDTPSTEKITTTNNSGSSADLSGIKCDKIGTRSEGWYYPDGTLYKWADCSPNEEVKSIQAELKNTQDELEKLKKEKEQKLEEQKKYNESLGEKAKINPSFSGALNNEQAKKLKEELKRLQEEKQKNIEANKEKIKENRDSLENAREEVKSGSGLTDDQKQKIKALNEAKKAEIDPLLETLRSEKDLEKRKILLEEINTINKKYAEQIKAIAGTNEAIGTFIDKKTAVLDANKELRQENLDTRVQARAQKSALIEKYKTTFMEKLKSKLDNISIDNLEKILAKVNTMVKTTTNNAKLSATSKENLLAQLTALQEIIGNKIDEATIVNDEINLDSLFQ